MQKETLWQVNIELLKTLDMPDFIEVDTLIIGGGLAGISTLFELRNNKDNIILIDSDYIGYGVTSRTTGKLTFMQELIYHKLEKIFNFDTARLYLNASKDAIAIVKNNVDKYKIDCDFTTNTSYVYTDNVKEIKEFKKEEAFYNRVHQPYQKVTKLPIELPSIYALKTSSNAVFNPVKYLYHLARLCIKENKLIYQFVRALTITKENNKYTVKTNKGIIHAKKVIVTTHYPFFINPGFIPLKSHIENSFVTASLTDNIKKINIITSSKPTNSFRYYKGDNNYFIYAANSCKPDSEFNYEKAAADVNSNLYLTFGKTPTYTWHTHDIMTDDKLPFIGSINANNPNLLIATGFNKWGMTNSIIASRILSDIVNNIINPYALIFDPKRSINFEQIKNLFTNTATNVKSLIKAKIIKDQYFYQDNVKITYEHGHRIGIFKDESGIIHKVKNICPHMKCNLIFNNIDNTWDCPCHGSRFDIDGNVVQGPSVYSIKLDNIIKKI